MSRFVCLLLAAAAGVLADPAAAVDGVIEINQTRALAGGVTPGDTAGFPVLIYESGSYRLTGNLSVPSANAGAIVVYAKDVTLDLNGFTISGPNSYVNPYGCTADGTGSGVYAHEAGVVVRNGHVRGMGDHGVWLNERMSRIEDVIAEENCGTGLRVGLDGAVSDSHARANYGYGISAGDVSRVRDSIADLNALSGISVGNAAIVTGGVSVSNALSGISFGSGSGLSIANVATGNQLHGITGNRVLIVNNALLDNTGSGQDDPTYEQVGGAAQNLVEGNGIAQTPFIYPLGCNVVGGSPSCPTHP